MCQHVTHHARSRRLRMKDHGPGENTLVIMNDYILAIGGSFPPYQIKGWTWYGACW